MQQKQKLLLALRILFSTKYVIFMAALRSRPVEICWSAPNSPTDHSLSRAEVHHIVRTCGGDTAV